MIDAGGTYRPSLSSVSDMEELAKVTERLGIPFVHIARLERVRYSFLYPRFLPF
jgi:hypothetical protein